MGVIIYIAYGASIILFFIAESWLRTGLKSIASLEVELVQYALLDSVSYIFGFLVAAWFSVTLLAIFHKKPKSNKQVANIWSFWLGITLLGFLPLVLFLWPVIKLVLDLR